jgi:hypothetical protein
MYSVGTDEHGLKIQQAAAEAQKNPQGFCDEISQEFKVFWFLYFEHRNSLTAPWFDQRISSGLQRLGIIKQFMPFG